MRYIKKLTGIALMVAAASFTGCVKEPPKCSDEDTLTLVRKIILDQIGGSEKLTEKEIKDNLKIEYSRASAFEEKIKKFSCDAKLIVGGTVEMPITYESQLDDNNQHIVSVGGISEIDRVSLELTLAVSLKKGRGIKDEPVNSASAVAEPMPAGDAPMAVIDEVADLPQFEKDETYSSVRIKMINAGWEPLHSESADTCSESDSRCKDRPEMESCAGTGMANCKFLWKKNEKTTAICTVGEDAIYDGICN